ncbi:glycosyltransferase family 4 protein [Oleiphilus messinensis]|nr:glycosyltransferase family 4 protein [Oleiphilus messinensis]
MPKRIAFLMYTTGFGGLERKALTRASHLKDQGSEIIIYFKAFEGDETFQESCAHLGLHSHRIAFDGFIENWQNRLALKVITCFCLLPVLRFNPDIVYVPFNWTSHGMSFLWFANLFRIPSIVSIHGMYPEEPTPTPWYQNHTKDIFKNTRHIFAVSPSALMNFRTIHAERLNQHQIEYHTIPNWIELDKFCFSPAKNQELKTQWNISENAVVFGIVCRLVTIKRVELCIHLFNEYLKINPDMSAKLLIIGSGPEQPKLMDLCNRLKIATDVMFTGYQSNVNEWYSVLDVNILTSRCEGFPNAILEGMAAGCLTAVCNSPGLADLVDDDVTGIVFDVEKLTDAANHITAILTNPQRLFSLRKKGLRFSRNYEITHIKEKYLSLFNDGEAD